MTITTSHTDVRHGRGMSLIALGAVLAVALLLVLSV
jgi:hypothetical protein